MKNFLKVTILVVLLTTFLLSNFSAKQASAQLYACNGASILAKPTQTSSGSSEIFVKPAASSKAYIKITLPGGGILGGQPCMGYARVFYKWLNSKNDIDITKSIEFNAFNGTTAKEGSYQFVLQLATDQNFNLIYQEETATISVVKDPLNPPANNSNNANNANNSNNANNTNTPNPSLNNNQINTGIGVSYGMDLDANLGRFFNPLQAGSVPELISSIIRVLFLLIGIAAVIIIIIAGFRMVLASGNEAELTKAKKALTWAVIGLIVSLMSFSIVSIIQNLISRQ